MSRPLCIDLFCGLGGWAKGFLAAGYRIVGYDIERDCAQEYPGEFACADVKTLDGSIFQEATAIVASPPCQQFSQMNAVRKIQLPPPDMSCVDAAFRIRKESGVQTVIENVRDARKWFPEPSVAHRGAYYLWGDVPLIFNMKVPLKMGAAARAKKADGTLGPQRLKVWGARSRSEAGARERAKVPFSLAYPIALGMLSQ